MDFDITILIQEIKNRKPLWQKDNYDHNCRDVINKLWLEVAEVMGVSKDLVKAKWKGLRDNFRSELRKIPKKHHDHRSKWIYFNDMMFLKDQMSTRSPSSYMAGDAEDINIDVDVYTMDGDDDNVDRANENEERLNYVTHLNNIDDLPLSTTYPYTESVYETQPHSTVDIGNLDDPPQTLGDALSVKWHCGEQSSESGDVWEKRSTKKRRLDIGLVNGENLKYCDDDYYFLMSLLPTIKMLPLAKKMFLRLKIQELVNNEISSLCPTTTTQIPTPPSP